MPEAGAPGATGAAATAAVERPKPLLRGVSHEVFFFVSLVTGPLLIAEARTTIERVCVAIYALSITAMLGTSALFHRHTWSPEARRRMRRADHSMIFVLVAGSYTAIAGLSLSRGWAVLVVGLVWLGAIAGIVMRLTWLDAPKWAVAMPYVVVGWIAVIALPELLHALGGLGFALVLAGGLAYTLGALAYARKRPDPWPRVFGYHEVFHAFVILALVLHYCLVYFIVLPNAVR